MEPVRRAQPRRARGPVNVLYLDHTSLISGAQRALLDLLEALPRERITPTMVCPPGPLADAVRELEIEVIEFPGTSVSFRLHPVNTPWALVEITRSAFAVARAARRVGADVIHANSLRAGLIAGVARPASGAPVVLHVHDALPPARSAALVRRLLLASSSAVITISDYTTENFAAGASRDRFHMLHNPLDTTRFDPALSSKAEARDALGIDRDEELLGVVAQITPWKGQDVAIRALHSLRDRSPKVRLLLVGETKFVDRATRYDNRSYLQSLHELAEELALGDRVEFLGERADVPRILRALDVLLAPSWEEPFGRSVIEAMALETAVVATNVGGPAEYIADGVDGRVLAPREPEPWAAAIDELLADPQAREQMAQRGSRKVRELFDRDHYVARVLDVYDDVCAPTPRVSN